MSESVSIELWENQVFHQKVWISDIEYAWCYKNNEACNPPDEIQLPQSGEWCWASNWRIDRKPGCTDADGWEYASKYNSFAKQNRKPCVEKQWNTTVRRRLWSRVMRREALSLGKITDWNKALPRIQQGLSSIHAARLRIEEISRQAPEAMQSEQMISLITSVKKNIADILGALNQFDEQQTTMGKAASPGTQSTVIKKLKKDVQKEETAIDKVLNESNKVSTPKFKKLGDKKQSFSGPSTSSNTNRGSSFSSLPPTPNTKNPPLPPKKSFDNDGRTTDGLKGKSNLETSKDVVQSMNLKPSVVKGGSAASFNPSALTEKNSRQNAFENDGDWESPKDGVFVDRNMQHKMIEKKLKAVDEATVMQTIIDERSEEIQKIYKGIVQVQDMFNDLSRIVKEQQVEIDKIFSNVDESHAKTQEAFKNIVAAEKLQRNSNCIIS